MIRVYNCFGEDVTDMDAVLADENYGIVGESGKIVPKWAPPSDFVDEKGFDKTHFEPNGEYCMKVELPKGTKLLRYGPETGRLTAPIGTPYELLGLPYKVESLQYHEYEVIADGVVVKAVVTRGIVAPMFGSKGGGIQYLHEESILYQVRDKILKEVFEWIDKKK